MANEVKKVNTVAIADIKNINTITDTNLKKLNTLEFTGVTDAHTLISTPLQISDGSVCEVDIESGIDNTYDVYEIHFINLHPATNSYYPVFRASTDGGSNYGVATTSTFFRTYHTEADATSFSYITSYDAAQSVGDIYMSEDVGSDDADKSGSGIMRLYAPSSTTYVKHFQIEMNIYTTSDNSQHSMVAGYINTTSAVNAMRFKFSHGNIDSGTIRMYGISKS